MERTLLRWGIITAVLVAVLIISRIARNRPNRSRKHPDRVRAPKILAFFGWLMLLPGLLFTAASFAGGTNGPLPLGAKVTALGLVFLGVTFLLAYFRWYLVVEYDFIERRGMILPPRRISYRDIDSLRITQSGRQQILKITPLKGSALHLNMSMFNVDKLLAWATFTNHVGRPPSPQEVQFHKDTGQWPSVTPEQNTGFTTNN